MKDNAFFVVLFRLKDPWDNKRTLSVVFEVKGLEIKMRYQLYSSWEKSGIPHSISNLSCRNMLPETKSLFLTEQIEDEILNLDDDKTDFINYHFSNVLTRIENALKSEQLSKVEIR
jgi:hypothetical protein